MCIARRTRLQGLYLLWRSVSRGRRAKFGYRPQVRVKGRGESRRQYQLQFLKESRREWCQLLRSRGEEFIVKL